MGIKWVTELKKQEVIKVFEGLSEERKTTDETGAMLFEHIFQCTKGSKTRVAKVTTNLNPETLEGYEWIYRAYAQPPRVATYVANGSQEIFVEQNNEKAKWTTKEYKKLFSR